MTEYSACSLCAHACGVDRNAGLFGICGQTSALRLARAALHYWEEPPISGTRGSGAVFFSGCSLGCVFCQNREISAGGFGKDVPNERLSDICLELQAAGAHNINFVTPTHFVPTVREQLALARTRGLTLPAVYNTASFDTVETLRSLAGEMDIYLPDFKYMTSRVAEAYSHAADYPEVAKRALAEMMRQQPSPVFDEDGLMQRGVIARVLLLPGHVAEAKRCVGYLYKTYGDSLYISLMNQYTPHGTQKPPLNRTVTHEEYRDLCDYADRIGVKNGFVQEFGTASDSFIPMFDTTGV